MAVSLEKKLAGKEAEAVKTIKEFSIGDAMQLYNIKSRRTFLKWVREHTNGEWELSPLVGMKGGPKMLFMMEHRETILDCLEIFGKEWVKDKFCFGKDATLDGFIKHDGRPPTGKLTRLQRAELNAKEALCLARKLEKQMEFIDTRFSIVDEGQRKIGVRQNETVEQVNNFETRVANDIGGIFTQALGQGLGKFITPAKEMLPQPPDLSINSVFDEQRSKAQAKEEAKEAKKAEAIAKKEAQLAAKEKAKREAQETKERAKREAETKAIKEATVVAKEVQRHPPRENPLVETIARLKG